MPGRSLLPSAGGNAARGRAVEPQSCSCAEPVLYCSCADHDRLRSIRGIPAPVFSCVRDRVAEFRVCVAAWQAGAAPRLSGALRGDSEVQCRTGAFWGNQGLTGASRFRGLLPALTAQLRCAAALGVPRCIGFYLRKRSCRHTAAFGSLSLSVCVATLLHSGSTHRHSQGLQRFLNRSPTLSSTLSGSFQKNLRLS